MIGAAVDHSIASDGWTEMVSAVVADSQPLFVPVVYFTHIS